MGRKEGQLDKMTPELQEDIEKFLSDRSIKQIDLMNKYHITEASAHRYLQKNSMDRGLKMIDIAKKILNS